MWKLPNGCEVDVLQVVKIYIEKSSSTVIVRLSNGVGLFIFNKDGDLKKIHNQLCDSYRKELNRVMDHVTGASE